MATTGTYSYVPVYSDIVLDAFERCGIGPAQIAERRLMQSAGTSANLILSHWPNRGLNLWATDQQSLTLQPGVSTYPLPANTVQLLDCYIRTFQLSNTLNVAPNFSTTLNSPVVTVVAPNHGLSVGSFVSFGIPVSVGGLLLTGFYSATSVIDANTFTITAGANATATVANGGAVPSFTTAIGTQIVTVTLPNHGLLPGYPFQVGVQTAIAGLVLFGSYVVATVINANQFTITALGVALANSTVAENGGLAQLLAQSSTAQPEDTIVYPLGHSEFDMIPDKFLTGQPTTYWFERLVSPVLHLWTVPDNFQPYVFYYRRMRTLQDYSARAGVTMDMPNRFARAFTLELAMDLASKHAPERFAGIATLFQKIWDEAWSADIEDVPLYVQPILEHYWRP